MQAYRLLNYRFAGLAATATLAEEVSLLSATRALPALFPKALSYAALRPLRALLLRFLFAGIYR
jgi:hypothetical protein